VREAVLRRQSPCCGPVRSGRRLASAGGGAGQKRTSRLTRAACLTHALRLAVVVIPAVPVLLSLTVSQSVSAEHPLSEKERRQIETDARDDVRRADAKLVSAYSQRGDARFFLGKFDEALADYDMMVELKPELASSHWRRGIARFYAGKVKAAAEQFEAYHSFDNVDRENGIWRYFSQYRAYGPERAREGLLKYRKTDREPFPGVYRLFSGEKQPEGILASIHDAEISRTEREKRLFYAELYIGLNHAIEGREDKASRHLREATGNSWPRQAGYGPNYMWHVGRLHYNRLMSKKSSTPDDPPGETPPGENPAGENPAGETPTGETPGDIAGAVVT